MKRRHSLRQETECGGTQRQEASSVAKNKLQDRSSLTQAFLNTPCTKQHLLRLLLSKSPIIKTHQNSRLSLQVIMSLFIKTPLLVLPVFPRGGAELFHIRKKRYAWYTPLWYAIVWKIRGETQKQELLYTENLNLLHMDTPFQAQRGSAQQETKQARFWNRANLKVEAFARVRSRAPPSRKNQQLCIEDSLL
ncbi:hypothetical protein LENED_004145 [Lentinula edodes]|uniref:Uncharacterized protein n=1 Tax=Lentinula edodes TaxID=5353 RepID=A0A1Q3E5E5_LENED|nr:hypothetical protein LENED_004145 [Lentinula edodes]